MIPPRADLDDEGTRLLTYQQAHAASVKHLDALASSSAGIRARASEPSAQGVATDIHPVGSEQPDDDLTDDLAYRAALAALSGVVQRSLRDFLA